MAIDIKLEANGADSIKIGSNTVTQVYLNGTALIDVAENTAPVISIIGDNPMYLLLNGSAYVEQGATANDLEDGDITNDIVIGGDTPDVSVEGYYYVTYNVSDSEGLAADEQTRTVEVYVVTVPKYEMTEPLFNDGTFDYVDDSNNPERVYDGKLTESDGTTPYLPTELEYTRTGRLELANGRIMDTQYTRLDSDAQYGIYDADGSTTYKIWAIQWVISNQYAVYEGDQDTPIALVSSDAELTIPGGTMKITDGRPSWLPLPDTTIPVITMLGTSPIDVDQDSVYTDAGATALDDVDGDITADIVTVNNVDTATEGAYNVTYNVDDSSGNSADEVTRVVNVVSAEVFVPIHVSFDNTTANPAMPDGVTINSLLGFSDTSTIVPLVDQNNDATSATFQLTGAFESSHDTGANSGNNSNCLPDYTLNQTWRRAFGSATFDLVLPVGTYQITIGGSSYNDVSEDNWVNVTLDSLMQTIDMNVSSIDHCKNWTDVVSDGATPITVDLDYYPSIGYYVLIGGLKIERTA